MLRDYFNYVQNVLGVKSFLAPVNEAVVDLETSYHFATATLIPETKEILINIIKALKAKKFDIVELKVEKLQGAKVLSESPAPEVQFDHKAKSILIIFGQEAAQFLIPNSKLEFGQSVLLSGSQTLVTHSIEDMRIRPELKREAWQHLKSFVNE